MVKDINLEVIVLLRVELRRINVGILVPIVVVKVPFLSIDMVVVVKRIHYVGTFNVGTLVFIDVMGVLVPVVMLVIV